MKKYTLTGEYTIIYVKEQTIEASSHEEAEEKFKKVQEAYILIKKRRGI